MSAEMILFDLAPLSMLLLLIWRAIYKITKQNLRVQFFISDIAISILCLVPSVYFVANAISHPADEWALFLALLVPPCQLLSIIWLRLRHTILQREVESSVYIVGGGLLGLAAAGASYVGFFIYLIFFTHWCC